METEKNNVDQALFNTVLSLADSTLILSHRLSEWCGHGPIIEQDIAMSNIALDLLRSEAGRSRKNRRRLCLFPRKQGIQKRIAL